MSRREDLETQIVAQLKTVSALAIPGRTPTTFNIEAAAAVGFTIGDGPFPEVRIVCQRFKRTKYDTIAGVTRVHGTYQISIVLTSTLAGPVGAARLGSGGGYDLAQQIDAAMNTFQPVLGGAAAVFPCVLEEDDLFSVDQTTYGVNLSYTLEAILDYYE